MIDNRPSDFTDIFENKDIGVISKLGPETARKLEDLGITQVVQLKDLPKSSIVILTTLKVYSLKAILGSVDSSLSVSFLYTMIDY